MEKQSLLIEYIPAILWGRKSDNVIIAVHGDQSNKADEVIKILAEEAILKGYQVLSFDLPEHGDRKKEPRLCKVQNSIEDLNIIYSYAKSHYANISLFGCSIGAYFGMMAYNDKDINEALFLTPAVDMKRIIDNIMAMFDISEERLELEKEISTSVKPLYWDYYRYVVEHPVQWTKRMAILHAENDNFTETYVMDEFAKRVGADLTIHKNGEHYFHTEEQLSFYREWLRDTIYPTKLKHAKE